MNQEEFIEQLFNSTIGITKVNPSDDLFSKIEIRINDQKVLPMKIILMVAASIVLLIGVNMVLISQKVNNTDKEILVFAKELNKSNQLY